MGRHAPRMTHPIVPVDQQGEGFESSFHCIGSRGASGRHQQPQNLARVARQEDLLQSLPACNVFGVGVDRLHVELEEVQAVELYKQKRPF